MENLTGRWYETSGNKNYKLEISNSCVTLFSNFGQKHPAFFDTVEFQEEYIGKENGTIIELSRSIKMISYNSNELKIAILITTNTGNLYPMSLIKRP